MKEKTHKKINEIQQLAKSILEPSAFTAPIKTVKELPELPLEKPLRDALIHEPVSKIFF